MHYFVLFIYLVKKHNIYKLVIYKKNITKQITKKKYLHI